MPEEGRAARRPRVGDVVKIPPNVKDWHGAQVDRWFSHIAVEVPRTDASNEWCELATDKNYEAL